MKTLNQPKKNGAMKRRAVAALCAVVMLAVCVPMIGGTLAYLIDKTPELVNKFELGELKYKLVFETWKPDVASANVENMPNAAYEKSIAAPTYTFDVTEKPTLTGYEFLGWSKEQGAEAAEYIWSADKASVPVDYDEDNKYDVATATTTKTVYPVWKQMDFVLSFDTQVADVENPKDMTVTYQLPYGELPVPVRIGYTFLGWTHERVSTDYITSDTIVDIADNHTVYAQWKANSYVVHYNVNGGSGTMADQTFTYDVRDFLRENTFKKTGYDFIGWSLEPNGEVVYGDKQFVQNLTDKNEITLYAVWNAGSIVVTFESGSADYPAAPLTKIVTFDQKYGTLAEAAIEGYKFLGWYTEPEGKGTHVTPDTIVKNEKSHTLYAKWETPQIDLLLMYPGSGTSNFTTFAKHSYEFEESIVYTGQTWQGKWESFSIQLGDLEKGATYRLKFDAAFSDRTCIRDKGDNEYPIGCKVDDHLHYAESESTENYDWVPTSSKKSTKGYVIEFVATEETMFWLWELSKIRNPGEEYGTWKPGVENFEESYFDLTLDNISLTKVMEPADIKFEETSAPQNTYNFFNIISKDDSFVKFEHEGGGGKYEKVNIPIVNLKKGQIYTVDFVLKSDARGDASNTYHFRGLIGNKASTTNNNSFGTVIEVWDGDNFIEKNGTRTVTASFSFEATADKMYWIWDMTCVVNGGRYSYDLSATIKADNKATVTVIERNNAKIAFNLSGVDATGAENAETNQPVMLTLRGNNLPDVLSVQVTDTQSSVPAEEAYTIETLYMTGLNEQLVEASAAAEDALAQTEWLESNEDGSQTLNLPAELMTAGAEINITGKSFDAMPLTEYTINELQ